MFVDELAGEGDGGAPDQYLLLYELQLTGSTGTREETGEQWARLTVVGIEVASRDAADVYRLLWVPSELI